MIINVKERFVGAMVLVLVAGLIIIALDNKALLFPTKVQAVVPPPPVAQAAPLQVPVELTPPLPTDATSAVSVAPISKSVSHQHKLAIHHPHHRVKKIKTAKIVAVHHAISKQKKIAHKKMIAHHQLDRSKPVKPHWNVQVGLFSQQSHALQLAKKMRAQGFKVYVITQKMGKKKIYKVYAGSVSGHSQAIALSKQLKKHLHIKGIVVAA